jgi:hypothetical protein
MIDLLEGGGDFDGVAGGRKEASSHGHVTAFPVTEAIRCDISLI